MHHATDRKTHTTAFVTPVVEHWLEREIAQWVHPMKDRSDDPSHHERTPLPRSYISLQPSLTSAVNKLSSVTVWHPHHIYDLSHLSSNGLTWVAQFMCISRGFLILNLKTFLSKRYCRFVITSDSIYELLYFLVSEYDSAIIRFIA